MVVFILDKYKLTKFNLPEKVDDSFLIPYKSYNNKNDIFVTVEASDGNWQLKSNGTVNIIENSEIIESSILVNYGSYYLKILGQEEPVVLYSLPSKEVETYKLKLSNKTDIKIGTSQSSDIYYKNDSVASTHTEIKYVNNEWYIAANTDERYKTYVNGVRILTSKLKVGDVIFINGLRIIWMKTFIKINNPGNNVFVKDFEMYEDDLLEDNTLYEPVSDDDSNVDLYNEDDYFYHTPRLVPTINEEEIIIDAPPEGNKQEELPFILTLGTGITMLASTGIMGYNIVNSLMNGKKVAQLIPQIVMFTAMLIGIVIMPRIVKAYQKRRAKRKEKERQEKYKAYLDKMELKIQYALSKQTQILKENNLSTKECYDIILNKSRRFWLRELYDQDFLKVRLGTGDIDSYVKVQAPQEHFSLSTDNLFEMVYEVDKKSKKLINVPITVDLSEKTVLSFILNCSYSDEYVNSILTQVLALHSSTDLKIVLFTSKENEKKWEYFKFLPHCWSDERDKRFFATNKEEYKDLSSYLESQFELRKEKIIEAERKDPVVEQESQNIDRKNKKQKVAPYYLIITDNYRNIKNLNIVEAIQNSIVNYGFSIISISNNMKNIPARCEKFVQIGEKESCVFDKKISSQSQQVFVNEYEKNLNMNLLSIKLSNVPTITKDALSELPNNISFLDMYGVGKIEQLNILNRWHVNSPVSTLQTPIGVHSDGELFKLDLHEKAHGPHGLIAGMTGSGKSEFIITYILSLCVNYHPYEVQFVLIDYKGGGLAGAFENKETGVKVPHLVGTITNLDTAEMNRTLVSISSELKRRQRKFNEVKDKLDESTMDIYKYQTLYREGVIDEPMAHLFIISDEFAELKSQQPEFLSQLVSTARIGRSLGVHLILATQKPSGVVNDQIWSNSKFKVCLKVQDRSDSMEMLKRPDAASIKDVGRFYLQVGYADYFDIGQSGWCGAKYNPTDRILKKHDDSINYVNNIGNVIKTVNDISKKESTVDLGDQLTNIVKYIYNISSKENIVTKRMWLDKIPSFILINDIKKKYNYVPRPYYLCPVIGEYDDPAAQSQGLLNINLQHNLIIYGKSGSGKENLLTTIIWSSIVEHTPDEVNFYIIDCGSESLKMFHKMPHVGEVLNVDDNQKIMDLFNMISKEIDRRKDAYADYAGSYSNYCENSGNKDASIVVIINSYETFSETYDKLADKIQTLYRDGAKYGVTFIVTCLTISGMRTKLVQYFNNKITLQLANSEDYRTMLGSPRGFIPSSSFGRGLIPGGFGVYEFQTAYVSDPKEISNVVREASNQLSMAYTSRARKIPTIPEVPTMDTIKDEKVSLEKFPIGFDLSTKNVFNYNLLKNKFTAIVSENMPNRLDFATAIIKQLSKIQNINIKVVDFVNALDIENIKVNNSDYNKVIIDINNEIANEKNSDKYNYYIFVGIGEYESEISEQIKPIAERIFSNAKNYEKTYFIFIDNYSSYRKLQLVNWYKTQVSNNDGIWLGPNVANQMAFKVPNLPIEIRNLNMPYLGFVIEKGSPVIIKYIVDGENNEK